MAKPTNGKPRRTNNRGNRGTQGKKDSNDKRINLDNERIDKYEKDEGFTKSKACNDIAWYTRNPELLKASSSLPAYYTTGTPLPFNTGQCVPGVLSCVWNPSIGVYDFATGTGYDAINQAANSMYSFVVHANSRNKSYDAPDLMMLVLAGAQIFSAVALGIRAYGVMRRYEEQNLYLPKALVRAMGFDYDDLRDNLPNMWFDINEMVAKCSQIWIPNTMPIISRWFWMNSNIYMDATTPKSQYYLFVPENFYQYNETKYPTGGCLEPVNWLSSTAKTWAAYVAMMKNLFNALLDSQDRGIIFGDILKAYGADKIYTISEIPSDYMVTPIYDQEVLTQIENSTACGFAMGDIWTGTNFRISQKPYVTNTAPSASNGFWLPATQMLNYHNTQDVTPEMNMIATRLKSFGAYCGKDLPSTGDYSYWVYGAGSEYLSLYTIWTFVNGVLTPTYINTMLQTAITTGNLQKLMAFEWHPWLYDQTTIPTPSAVPDVDWVPDSAYGEFDNYTTINWRVLAKMHENALFSEFGVPTGF